MVIPKVSIGDLLNSSSNSTGAPSAAISHPTTPTRSSLVGNFINMLAKYADPVYNKVVNTAQDLGAGAIEPGREMINAAQGKPYQNPSPSAQRGLDMIQGGIMTSPSDVLAYQPDIPGIATQAKGAVNDVKNVVQETHANALAQPGGLQAGYIKPDAVVGNPAAQYPDGTILGPDGEPIVKPKAPEYGTKTAAQIKAEKARGLPPQVNSAEDIPAQDYGFEGAGPQAVNPNAEKLPPQPQPGSAPGTPSTPFPSVSTEPTIVTDRTGTHPVTGGNPVLVDLRNEAKKNPYYLEDQARARSVMDNYVAGNTPLEVEQNLPLQLTEESQRIKNIMAAKPNATADIGELVAQNEANLKKAGISPGVSTKADSATREALNEFDSQIPTEAGVTGKTTASGEDLVNYKNILDDKLQSAYKKENNGTSLTPGENAMRTLRRTINNKLKEMYPGMGDALDRQSAMMDARPSVAQAAGAEEKAQLTAAGKPKPGLLKKVLTNPLVDLVGGGAIVTGGVTGAQKLAGINAATKANKGNNSVPPLNGQKYSADTPLTTGAILNDSQYAAEKLKQQAIMDKTALTDPTGAYAEAKAAYDRNETTYNSQEKLRNTSTDTKTVVDNANSAASDLRKVDLGFFNALSKGYNSVEIQNNANYATLAGELQNLQNLTGIKLDQATSARAIQAGIDLAVKVQKVKQDAAQTQYLPVNTQNQGLSTSPQAIPQGEPTGLPSIPNAPVNWQQNDPRVQPILNQSRVQTP